MQRRSGKFPTQKFFERFHRLRRLQQTRTPLREAGRNLVVISFRDEIVRTGLGLKKRGLERPLRAIVRTQLKLGIDRTTGVRLKRA